MELWEAEEVTLAKYLELKQQVIAELKKHGIRQVTQVEACGYVHSHYCNRDGQRMIPTSDWRRWEPEEGCRVCGVNAEHLRTHGHALSCPRLPGNIS